VKNEAMYWAMLVVSAKNVKHNTTAFGSAELLKMGVNNLYNNTPQEMKRNSSADCSS